MVSLCLSGCSDGMHDLRTSKDCMLKDFHSTWIPKVFMAQIPNPVMSTQSMSSMSSA